MWTELGIVLYLCIQVFAQDCSLVNIDNTVVELPEGPVVAGRPYNFSIILRDNDLQPVCNLYDPLLAVGCPNSFNENLCTTYSLRPLGDGVYVVSLVLLTFKGAHEPWPPQYNPSARLPDEYFTGGVTFSVVYDEVHVPGSPFPIAVSPAEELSAALSVVNMVDPSVGSSGRMFLVARLYQVTDSYSNWIRNPDLINAISVKSASTGVSFAIQWWQNWWIEILARSEQSGNYSLEVLYQYPDGRAEPLRIQSAKGISFSGSFEVRPGVLEISNFDVKVSNTQIVAGSLYHVTVQSRDRFSNPTPLSDPAQYTTWLEQVQNSSLVTMSLSSGHVQLEPIVNATISPGGLAQWHIRFREATSYRMVITYHGSVMAVLFSADVDVVPGPPSFSKSTFDIKDTFEAGPLLLVARFADEWGNPTLGSANVVVSELKNGAQLLPSFRAVNQEVVYSVNIFRAGAYAVRISLGADALVRNITVIPLRTISLHDSWVSGYGAGSLSAFGPTPVTAGVQYSVWVHAYDIYGNQLHKDSNCCGLQIGGAGPTAVNTDIEEDTGKLGFSYNITVSGNYTVSLATTEGFLHHGFIQVRSAQAQYQRTKMYFPSTAVAGMSFYATVEFTDSFGNPAPVTGVLSVIITGGVQTHTTEVAMNGDCNATISLQLQVASTYAAYGYMNGILLGSTASAIVVIPATPAKAAEAILGAGVDTVRLAYSFYDAYDNMIYVKDLEDGLGIALEPVRPWEANVTFSRSNSMSLSLWYEPSSPQQTLTVIFRGVALHTYNWTSVVPMQEEDLRKRRWRGIVASACGALLLGCSLLICVVTQQVSRHTP
uniref:Gamete plasma membrane protein n=1 Tax=Gonium pectorale TaxID=33097 RepID=A0A140JWY0_GONPE|nr:gamete plasma membrane protein [Gonium pectorale]